jgi:hypothetical protein
MTPAGKSEKYKLFFFSKEIDNQDFEAGMRKDEAERSNLNPKSKF